MLLTRAGLIIPSSHECGGELELVEIWCGLQQTWFLVMSHCNAGMLTHPLPRGVGVVEDALYFWMASLLVVENPLHKSCSSGRLQYFPDPNYMADVGAEVEGKGELPQDPLS